MINLTITTNLEKTPWPDMSGRVAFDKMLRIDRIGRLPRGTMSGKSTVAFAIELPDGRFVMAETTMELFKGAARALIAADEFDAFHSESLGKPFES